MSTRSIGPIETKSFWRTVAALVVPMALQNLINVAVQSADVMMLGQLSEVSLSAASLAGQIQFVMMLIFFGLSSGASVLTAQYWGKGDTRTIEKVMAITLRFSMVIALIFVAAVYIAPAALMRVFTPEQAVIDEGVRYLRFIAPSYLIIGFTNIYLNIMRSVEKAVVSVVVYSISLGVNVGLNAVLIFGMLGAPAMGVAGAALATTLARVLELAIVIVYAARNPLLRLRARDFKSRHPLLMRDFRRYALPTTINELIWGLGVAANAVIIGHLGASAVAANSVGQVVRQLATVISFGVANATAIVIGKALGSGSMAKAILYARRMTRLALATGGVGMGLVLVIRPLVLSLMNLSEAAMDYLSYLLLIMCVYTFLQAFNATLIVGVFRGGGDTRFGAFLDGFSMWGFSILWGALAGFVFHWPVKAVFTIVLLDEILKLPFALLRYRSKRWLRNVTRDEVD